MHRVVYSDLLKSETSSWSQLRAPYKSPWGSPHSDISSLLHCCPLLLTPAAAPRVSSLAARNPPSQNSAGFLFLASSGPSYLWWIANTFISCRKKTATNCLVVRKFYLVWGIVKAWLNVKKALYKTDSTDRITTYFCIFLYLHFSTPASNSAQQ